MYDINEGRSEDTLKNSKASLNLLSQKIKLTWLTIDKTGLIILINNAVLGA